MSEVTQTIFYDPDLAATGVRGNCVQAAVASVLDLPLDAVPHFMEFTWWHQAMELWARGRGLTVRREQTDVIPDRRCIVAGLSPRGAGVQHAVVGEGGQIVWDPHPSREGLLSVIEVSWFEPWPNDEHACWNCHQEYA